MQFDICFQLNFLRDSWACFRIRYWYKDASNNINTNAVHKCAPAEIPENYFQRMNCIPLLENISDMKDRFLLYIMSLFNLNVFLLRTSNKDIAREIAEKYEGFLNVPVNRQIFQNIQRADWKLYYNAKPKKRKKFL